MTTALLDTPRVPRGRSTAPTDDVDALREELAFLRAVIRRTADACESAAQGDLEARVLDFEHPGDGGRLMRSVNRILDVSDAFVREATASLEHASNARFFRRVLLRGMPGSYRHAAVVINRATDAMAAQARELQATRSRQLAFADQFEATIRTVVATLAASATEMQATARSLAATAETTADQANSVSATAVQTASSVQTVAAAAEELTGAIGEVSRRVNESAALAAQVSDAASTTDATMARLSEMSQQIGRVTKLITQIAAHTKLLALNATIEAVRAGDAGRGFAVVASEVKTLAQSTATATDEISRHIQQVQTATRDAAGAITGIARTVEQLKREEAAIAASVREQGAATKEISRNIHEAANGADSVGRSIVHVSTAVDETRSAASQLLAAAGELSQQSETLMTGVDQFLALIRSEGGGPAGDGAGR